MSRKMLLAVAAACCAQAASAEDLTLNLRCTGSGSSVEFSVTGRSHQRRVRWRGEALVEIDGASGRIRLPSSERRLRENEEDNWVTFTKLEVSEPVIRGSAPTGLLGRIHVMLDRYAGTIHVSTPGSEFTGRCKPFAPEDRKRAF